MQDTGKFRINTKDKYYTKASVANECVNAIQALIADSESYQWIEPSAGNGSFLKALPQGLDSLGIDIEPKTEGIVQGDFLQWAPTTQKKRIFFGNPPFGRQSSLAKEFIKHAALYADYIAFILPRSFVKPSMSKAFPLQFHCIFSKELEKNSFEVNNKKYDVPCVFQIWQKKQTNRIVEQAIKEEGFTYVKYGEPFHIAFKRVGGLAGTCYPSTHTVNENNKEQYNLLKLEEPYVEYIDAIINEINQYTFPSNTVGMRSLSKSEANEVINAVLVPYS